MERKGRLSGRTASVKATGVLRPGLGSGPALSNQLFYEDGKMFLVLFHNVVSSHLTAIA